MNKYPHEDSDYGLNYYIDCACHCHGHILRITVEKAIEQKDGKKMLFPPSMYISNALTPRFMTFWQRVKSAVLFLFKKGDLFSEESLLYFADLETGESLEGIRTLEAAILEFKKQHKLYESLEKEGK